MHSRDRGAQDIYTSRAVVNWRYRGSGVVTNANQVNWGTYTPLDTSDTSGSGEFNAVQNGLRPITSEPTFNSEIDGWPAWIGGPL